MKLRKAAVGADAGTACGKDRRETAFISDVEQGVSFPHYDRLIKLIDGLETSSDVLFQDVIQFPFKDRHSLLSDELRGLPPDLRKRILDFVDFAIRQYKRDLEYED